MQPIIKKLIFSYLIPEQKLYYPESAITWNEMLSQSIRSNWWPGIAASWWRVPKLQYTTIVMAAASTNQVEMLRMLHEIGAPFLQKHLHRAAQCGNTDAYRVIVPHVANRNIEQTLLMAVHHRRIHTVKFIHAMFPNTPLRDAFCTAVSNQHWEMIILICSFGYVPNDIKGTSLAIVNFCLDIGGLHIVDTIDYAAKTGNLNIIKVIEQKYPINYDSLLIIGINHATVAKYALAHKAIVTEQVMIHAAAIDSVDGMMLVQPMYCGSYDSTFCTAAYYGSRSALVWLHNAGARSYSHAMYNAAHGNHTGIMRLIRYWNPGNYIATFERILDEGVPQRVINLFQLWQ